MHTNILIWKICLYETFDGLLKKLILIEAGFRLYAAFGESVSRRKIISLCISSSIVFIIVD
jgi:hypothetical protein